MKNDQLPNITKIGNGSKVRAAVAQLIGYVNTYSNATDADTIKAFFTAAAAATTGRAVAPPEEEDGGEEGE